MNHTPVYASTAGIAHAYPTLPNLLTALRGAGQDQIELGWTPPLGGLVLPEGLGAFEGQWLVHNYFPPPTEAFVLNLASQDTVTLGRSREFGARAIRLCARLGAPFYSVHCGFLAEFEPGSLGRKLTYVELCDYETGYATFRESLRLLLAEAEQAGIRLLVEPNVVAPMNLIDGRNRLLMLAEADEFKRLLADVSDPRLGILLDLGHLKVTAATLGFSAASFVDAVAPAIGAFHLHDNDGTADQHQPARPDSWAVALLKERRFAGLPVVVEAKFKDASDLAAHCIHLKNLLNH